MEIMGLRARGGLEEWALLQGNTWSSLAKTLATWCKEPTHWKRPWCWERLKAKREGVAEDEVVGWHHWLDMNLSKLGKIVEDRGAWRAWRAAVYRVAKSLTHHALASEQQTNYSFPQSRAGEAALHFLCEEKSLFIDSLAEHTFTERLLLCWDLDILHTSCL